MSKNERNERKISGVEPSLKPLQIDMLPVLRWTLNVFGVLEWEMTTVEMLKAMPMMPTDNQDKGIGRLSRFKYT